MTRSAGAHIARWEYLVELQLEADEHEAAVETFAVAHTLASVGWHQDAKQRLDKLAEEHDLPDPRPGSHEAALELLRRTGIRELTDEPLTLELGLGEVATLLVPYGGNGPTLWSIRPTELGQEPRFATRECSSGLKSEGDHGMVVGLTSSLGLGNIRARVEDLGGRLRLTLNPDD